MPSNADVIADRKRLWLLVYAATACEIVEGLCSLVEGMSAPEQSPAYYSIITSIYVVYGRPSHVCRGVGKLSESDVPPSTLPMHKELMTFRDKIYGHKDSSGIQLEEYEANEVRALVASGSLRFFATELFTRPPRIRPIIGHVQALQQHFSSGVRALVDKHVKGLALSDGEYRLNIYNAEGTILEPIPKGDRYAG